MTGRSMLAVVVGRLGALLEGGLTDVLEADSRVKVVGLGLESRSLRGVVAARSAEVVVIDERDARASLMASLRGTRPGVGVVVLVTRATPARAATFISRGATACLSVTANASEVLETVWRAAESAKGYEQSLLAVGSPGSVICTEGLTMRELEVVGLLGRSLSNAEIAGELLISVETVRTHVKRVLSKLGLASRHALLGKTFVTKASVGLDAAVSPMTHAVRGKDHPAGG